LWLATTSGNAQVWTIEQSPSSVTVRVSVGDRESRVTTWTFGGPETSAPIAGMSSSTTASVVGSEIRIVGKLTLRDGSVGDVEESWNLSSDGNTLSVVTIASGDSGTTFRREQSFRRVH
jgi:hypothetical protein